MLRDICFDPLSPPSRLSVNRPLIPVFCYYSFTKKVEDRTGTSIGVGIVDPQLSSGYIDAVLRVPSSVLPDTVHAVVECRIQLLVNATEKCCCQWCRGIGAPPSGKKDEPGESCRERVVSGNTTAAKRRGASRARLDEPLLVKSTRPSLERNKRKYVVVETTKKIYLDLNCGMCILSHAVPQSWLAAQVYTPCTVFAYFNLQKEVKSCYANQLDSTRFVATDRATMSGVALVTKAKTTLR